MNIHIAIYKWQASATPQEITDSLRNITLLSGKIPGIIEIVCGQNTSKYGEGYTHAILVRGENQAAIDAYRTHPDHAKAAAQIEAIEAHGIGVDFET